MGIPLRCATCGDFIGIENDFVSMSRIWHNNKDFSGTVNIHCSGKGQHTKPILHTKNVHCGLSKRFLKIYPDTNTSSTWLEYKGPKNKLFLWLAIIFSGRTGKCYEGVLVNGKWTWWSADIGFFGEGYDSFKRYKEG